MCAVFQKVLQPSCIVTGQCLNPSSGVVVCHAEQPSILGAQCDPPLMRQCPAAWMDQDQTRDERHTIENKGQVGAMWEWGSGGVGWGGGDGGQSTAGPAWHKINHLFQGKQASHCPFEVLAMRARIQWRDRKNIRLPVDLHYLWLLYHISLWTSSEWSLLSDKLTGNKQICQWAHRHENVRVCYASGINM